MTVGGMIIGIFVSILPLMGIGIASWYLKAYKDHIGACIATILVSTVLLVTVWVGLFWYYGNTASGQRAMKTQRSELGDGIQRELTVYDMQGEVIAHYEGKFDIDFGSDSRGQRIMFDDEQGVRHVIYPGGGIVIVNEVPGK